MKKIFTLIAAMVLTVATFAADRRPTVTLKTSRNFQVVIDGKTYNGNGIMQVQLMRGRMHTIKVYQTTKAGFGFFNIRSSRLVDTETFQVGRDDLDISVDFRGQISIQDDNGWGNDHDRDHRYDNRDNRDRNDRDHGQHF